MSATRTRRVEVRRVEVSEHDRTGKPERQPEVEFASTCDTVLVEEPLEIHLDGDLVATTMRTPGSDHELAVGLLWAEGRIAGPPAGLYHCPDRGSPVAGPESVLCVQSGPSGVEVDRPDASTGVVSQDGVGSAPGRSASGSPRLGLTSSSCGVCGVEQIETLVWGLDPLPEGTPTGPDVLAALEAFVSSDDRSRQHLFGLTGGSHAAAAVDGSGSAIVVREDIGRHNAVDKVVGRLLLDGQLPGRGRSTGPGGGAAVGRAGTRARTGGGDGHGGDPELRCEELPVLLWVSGRASFEIVQKAWAAGFPAVASVGAVSAMAVEVAQRAEMMLLGFARGGRVTAYTKRGTEQMDRFSG